MKLKGNKTESVIIEISDVAEFLSYRGLIV